LNHTNILYTRCNWIIFKTFKCWRWTSGGQFERRNMWSQNSP